VLALLAFSILIVGIDAYIVVVALPEIGRELGFSAQTLQAVISGYAVTFGGFLLLGGRASDLLGRRRMFLLGLFLYAVSSLAGALSSSQELLIAEGPERNRALSVWGGAGAGGLVLGSLLGGVLTQTLGWEAVFMVNVPLALFALLAGLVLIPRRTRSGSSGAGSTCPAPSPPPAGPRCWCSASSAGRRSAGTRPGSSPRSRPASSSSRRSWRSSGRARTR
jgi:MFS family permease